MPSKVSLRVSSTHIPFQRLSKVSTAMISRNAPHNKARGLTQVSDLVSQSGSFGHWAGMKPRVGILHSRPFNILRKAEGRSDTTSWIWEGSSRLLAHGGLTVSSTAEPQIGSRAVRRVLAPSSTAVPVAVGLMAHVGSTFLHPVFSRRGSFWVKRFFNRMVNGPPV